MTNKALLCVLAAFLLAACGPSQQPQVDVAALRSDIQKKTERMYWIHLRLDTAATEIANAEAAAQEGNLSAAGFHAAEAYRSVRQADEALLELGTQMQAMAGLDQAGPGN